MLVSELLPILGLKLSEPIIGLDLSLLFFGQVNGFVPFVLLLLDSHLDVLVVDIAELVF